MQKTFCVTGATGYVAGHIIRELLGQGHRVHGTVRSLSKSPRLSALYALADEFPDQLELFQADLLTDGSFRSAMRGCEVVIHTASPFKVNVAHPQRDLVDPAVKGTQNVLQCVNQIGSVTRVVLTSSVAAMYGDTCECNDGPLDESRWNTSSSLTHQAYSYSKVCAERMAWEIAGAQDRWDLVSVNPSLVTGPAIGNESTSESFNILKRFGDGQLKTGAPPWGMGLVDVRDVAIAHVAAAMNPNAQGRYLCCAEDAELFTLSQALWEDFPNYPLPRRRLPKWLIWLAGPMIDPVMTRAVVSKNMGHKFVSDNRKIRKELGIEFRDVRPGIREMFAQLVEQGVVGR